jgi:hypothetical protein
MRSHHTLAVSLFKVFPYFRKDFTISLDPHRRYIYRILDNGSTAEDPGPWLDLLALALMTAKGLTLAAWLRDIGPTNYHAYADMLAVVSYESGMKHYEYL